MTEYIFIINLSWDININTNHYKFSQTLTNLTDMIFIIIYFFLTEGLHSLEQVRSEPCCVYLFRHVKTPPVLHYATHRNPSLP
jgi:hypothetical protein